jgi:hypothetical protein
VTTSRRSARPLALLFLLAVAAACAGARTERAAEVKSAHAGLPDAEALSHGAPSLWQRFDADRAHPRLVVLASPT